MALYTVLRPPLRPGEKEPDPLETVFVKDGFCWPALFIPELWLLFRRMWLVFGLYLLAAIAAYVIDRRVGGPIPGVFFALAHLLFALEGNSLRRWTLYRRGFRFAGVVEAPNVSEAEIRYFHELEYPRVGPGQPTPSRVYAALRHTPAPDVVPTAAPLDSGSFRPIGGGRSPPQQPPTEPVAEPTPLEEAPATTQRPFHEPRSAEAGEVVGLFPEPEGKT